MLHKAVLKHTEVPRTELVDELPHLQISESALSFKLHVAKGL